METKIEDALNKERDKNEKENVSISGSSNNDEEENDLFSKITESE